jgi:arylsulfatase A-like enzyme
VSLLDVTATTLALTGAKLPDYYDGQNLFGSEYKPVNYVIGARDRCDYTIDRIRSVRTDRFRYIRNYFPHRPMLQAQYRDRQQTVLDLKRLHEAGELSDYQDTHWFGVRPEEELYDLVVDPHQISNLARSTEHASILQEHRAILDAWVRETGDQGQHAETVESLKGTYKLWKERPIFKDAEVNPEYGQFQE